jgi:hypothetical protein
MQMIILDPFVKQVTCLIQFMACKVSRRSAGIDVQHDGQVLDGQLRCVHRCTELRNKSFIKGYSQAVYAARVSARFRQAVPPA